MNKMVSEINNIKNHLKEISLELMPIFEDALSLAPSISAFINYRKFNRLDRRITKKSEQLKRISMYAPHTKLLDEYISERISPIVLADIIEEHEDAKIVLSLNGFENVFIEENSYEAAVISYFDTLRSLRYVDIKRLFYLAGKIDNYPPPIEDSEEHAIMRNSDMKLKNMGLIGEVTGFSFGTIDKDRDILKNDIYLSLHAEKFINFISLEKANNAHLLLPK
ncbi:hypothetical protein [Peribacillus loiseleuriae]|uniref:hypothetical protein n=1 Tax=Peribacillus loiseleuriae TaxID=1679170 RepID=UPI000670DA21|nr:hypothetical protein [Peribacillus loiseleuriae]